MREIFTNDFCILLAMRPIDYRDRLGFTLNDTEIVLPPFLPPSLFFFYPPEGHADALSPHSFPPVPQRLSKARYYLFSYRLQRSSRLIEQALLIRAVESARFCDRQESRFPCPIEPTFRNDLSFFLFLSPER